MPRKALGKKINIKGDGYCCLRAFFVVVMNATFNREMIDVDFYNPVDAKAFEEFLDELAELQSKSIHRMNDTTYASIAKYFKTDSKSGKFRLLPRAMWVGPEELSNVFCDTKKYKYPPLVAVQKQLDGGDFFDMNWYNPEPSKFYVVISARELFCLRDVKYCISYASLHYEVFEPSFTITNEAMNSTLNEVWEMFQRDAALLNNSLDRSLGLTSVDNRDRMDLTMEDLNDITTHESLPTRISTHMEHVNDRSGVTNSESMDSDMSTVVQSTTTTAIQSWIPKFQLSNFNSEDFEKCKDVALHTSCKWKCALTQAAKLRRSNHMFCDFDDSHIAALIIYNIRNTFRGKSKDQVRIWLKSFLQIEGLNSMGNACRVRYSLGFQDLVISDFCRNCYMEITLIRNFTIQKLLKSLKDGTNFYEDRCILRRMKQPSCNSAAWLTHILKLARDNSLSITVEQKSSLMAVDSSPFYYAMAWFKWFIKLVLH